MYLYIYTYIQKGFNNFELYFQSTYIPGLRAVHSRAFSMAAENITPIEKTNNQSFDHNLRIHNTIK